ncbi:Ankyrin repeat-containing domain,Ankyrin repeat [Cinara cedri]|uniref:Ankyrin repeat-containing domain,Ankyrin repeat n=1 Tax=Cinara cedri TaxID=506608 RepID=A0A5E4NGD6_9HEMI|nr:Ankyrin repeat-containing domain,Ankyrin repeat [Cinara cedri]
MLSNLRWQEVLPGALYDELEKLNSGQNLNQRNVFNRLVAILQKYLEIFKQWEDIDNKKNKKKMSVDKTIQYNGFSGTLKHLLAGCGFNKILEALLIRDNSKNINAKNNEGKTPLDFAYASGNLAEMEAEEYTSRSIDVLRGQGGNTLLHLVTLSGDIQVIKDLLAAGADVKSKNEDGLTPLQLAATEEIFDVLLEAAAIDSYFTHTNITNVAEQTARAQ